MKFLRSIPAHSCSAPHRRNGARRALWLLAAAAVLAACSSRPDEADLTILFTTDVHGLVMPIDFETNAPAPTSLANVATYVKQVRQENPDGTILLDAGDWCSGQPSTYYFNYIDHYSPHIVPKAYNYLGYDAIGIGSSDIELGPKLYRERLPQQFHMPIVCANLVSDRVESKPVYKPYTIIERKGIRIAVLGLTRSDIDNWIPRQLFRGLRLEKMRSAAQKWMDIIQETEHPDLIVGLFHSGAGIDDDMDDANKLGNASVPTGKQTGGFDLILFGHDHQSMQEAFKDKKGGTFYAIEPLPRAQQVARADLHLKRRGDGRYDVAVKTDLVPMTDVAPDEEFTSHFVEETQAVNNYLDNRIGTISDPLHAADGLVGPSAIVDFIHDIQLWLSKADVSLSNFSVSRDVPAGDITMRDLFKIYQYNNQLYTIRMTGEEIDKFLEFGYGRQFNQMSSPDDHLLRFVYTDDGQVKHGAFGPELFTPQYHYTSASGIKYTVDVTKPIGERVDIRECHDMPFDLEHTYIVAINSHQVAGGGRYIADALHWTQADVEKRIVTSDVHDLRLSFANYLHLYNNVKTECHHNWEVIPHEWWLEAKDRDIAFLNKDFSR